MANLVIVESPSKASTIKGYLGSNYKVIASKGHVRDLPKSSLGVDIENNFDAHYINIRGKGDLIKEIRKEAKAANKIYLATDPDREGEAIAWHLAIALGIPIEKTLRVEFNEITKTAVKAAIKNPRHIDMSLVDSQQARRILDRIMGYKISPILWKAVKSGLSAGRVQSVATRIIVEREEEIKNFVPDEYWTINATLLSSDNKPFTVKFYGDRDGKIVPSCEDEAMKIVDAVSGKQFKVDSIKRSTRRKMPAPPFTTSTLQQEASRHLGFQSQRIMRVAQELYEGVNVGPENGGTQGLITYMRTDSLRVSAEAQQSAREFIGERYGNEYNTETPRVYKAKSGAQDAHEAIRPVKIGLEPAKIKSYLTSDQFKIYKLIWERFIASQMESAALATLTVDFENSGYIFRTGGYTVTFPGYMIVHVETEDDTQKKVEHDNHDNQKDIKLPDLKENEMLDAQSIDPSKHFTEAPARYNEASLIQFLEEKGIGRPSTYTPIITTIVSRNYVKRDGKALVPTPLGQITTDIMRDYFAYIVDYKFTAEMESNLDGIEHTEYPMQIVLSGFWKDFSALLADAEEKLSHVEIQVPVEETDIICDKCGSKMIVKNGRFGKFAACPNYPQCRSTKPLVKVNDEELAEEVQEEKKEDKQKSAQKKTVVADFKCEKCGSDMVLRTGRYGSFYACVNYPTCKTTKPRTKDIGVSCPKCSSKVVLKYGKNKSVFYSCEKYPTCDFSSWDMPINENCPNCGDILFRKKGKPVVVCNKPGCGFSKVATDLAPEEN